jgi:hypothetical protein
MSEEIKYHRRRFLTSAAMTLAAASLTTSSSNATPEDATSQAPPQSTNVKPSTNTSFGSLKQIDAGALNVGYAEAGPPDGPPKAVSSIRSLPVLHCLRSMNPQRRSQSYMGQGFSLEC